ncbi:MAG: hypothetical protein Q7K48_02520 [Fusobacterium sp. JB021]|nr:hypothetical protein [Fusobacterium sp. JB021]
MIKIIDSQKENIFLKNLLDRNQFEYEDINKIVSEILNDVKIRKDDAFKG